MTTSEQRRVVTLELTFDVDAIGADLLPGWPGSVSPHDPADCDPPIDGLRLALMALADKAARMIEDEMPTVTDATFVTQGITVGPRFNASDLHF